MKNDVSKIILWLVITLSVFMATKSTTSGHVTDPSQQANATYMALIITAIIVGGIYLLLRLFRKG